MAATRLHEVERAYFVRKLGGATAQEPLQNVKRRYISGFVSAGSPSTKIDELEKLFLRKIIADGGGTPTNNYLSTLWQQAVSTIGEVPTKFINDNKIIFYVNAP